MSHTQRLPMHTCMFARDTPCAACDAQQRGLRAVNQELMEARRFLDGAFASGAMEPIKLSDDWLRLIGAAIAYGRGQAAAEDTASLQDGALVDDHARFGFIEFETSGSTDGH